MMMMIIMMIMIMAGRLGSVARVFEGVYGVRDDDYIACREMSNVDLFTTLQLNPDATSADNKRRLHELKLQEPGCCKGNDTIKRVAASFSQLLIRKFVDVVENTNCCSINECSHCALSSSLDRAFQRIKPGSPPAGRRSSNSLSRRRGSHRRSLRRRML